MQNIPTALDLQAMSPQDRAAQVRALMDRVAAGAWSTGPQRAQEIIAASQTLRACLGQYSPGAVACRPAVAALPVARRVVAVPTPGRLFADYVGVQVGRVAGLWVAAKGTLLGRAAGRVRLGA